MPSGRLLCRLRLLSAMASEVHMPEPVCLIENTQTKRLVVHQEALQVLSEITQPVVVVGITGLYRTGKSYLMNRLARQRKGEGGPSPGWPRYLGSPPLYWALLRPVRPPHRFLPGLRPAVPHQRYLDVVCTSPLPAWTHSGAAGH